MATRKRIPKPVISPNFLQEKEAMFRAITQAMQGKDFSGPEEAQAFLNQFTGKKMSDITASLIGKKYELDAVERANDLYF